MQPSRWIRLDRARHASDPARASGQATAPAGRSRRGWPRLPRPRSAPKTSTGRDGRRGRLAKVTYRVFRAVRPRAIKHPGRYRPGLTSGGILPVVTRSRRIAAIGPPCSRMPLNAPLPVARGGPDRCQAPSLDVEWWRTQQVPSHPVAGRLPGRPMRQRALRRYGQRCVLRTRVMPSASSQCQSGQDHPLHSFATCSPSSRFAKRIQRLRLRCRFVAPAAPRSTESDVARPSRSSHKAGSLERCAALGRIAGHGAAAC